MRLEGKRAIITGAASGFGEETAMVFSNEGAKVALLDINIDACEYVSELINSKNKGASMSVYVDVADEMSVHTAFHNALNFLGHIDILVNCAGFGRSAKIQDLTLQEWTKMISVNMTGTFLCCREVIPRMLDRNYGKIVNLASICAQTGRMVSVDYAGAKSGIVGITRALALQVASSGINVNAIAPGPIATPLFQKNYTQDQVKNLMKTIPFARGGTARDIANLALFLSTDESGWITGETIAINGGAFIG